MFLCKTVLTDLFLHHVSFVALLLMFSGNHENCPPVRLSVCLSVYPTVF